MTWIRSHVRLTVFAVLVVAQLAAVIGFVAREESLLRGGTEIVLKARPVDPRDPLRGDYVILGYEIQDLDVWGDYFSAGDDLYVFVEQRGRYWVPVEYSRSRKSRSAWPEGTVMLHAVARTSRGGPGTVARVDYPDLGRYYVAEGTGNLPAPPDVVVAVSGDGTARIKRLEIDGVRWPSETVPQSREP